MESFAGFGSGIRLKDSTVEVIEAILFVVGFTVAWKIMVRVAPGCRLLSSHDAPSGGPFWQSTAPRSVKPEGANWLGRNSDASATTAKSPPLEVDVVRR